MTTTYAYEIDSVVTYQPHGQPAQKYRIVRRLPIENGGPQYRIRSEATGQERVADEVHLKGDS